MEKLITDVLNSALVPAICFFSLGWLLGTTDTFKSEHVDGINRFTLMISLPAMCLASLTKFTFSLYFNFLINF